jgi:hypothetical protein
VEVVVPVIYTLVAVEETVLVTFVSLLGFFGKVTV